MNQTAKGLVALTLALTLALPLGVGCATRRFPKGHISGYDFKSRDQSGTPYKLERLNIHGREYYAQELSKGNQSQDTLPFVFLPFDKVQRVIDLDTKRVHLESEEEYIPKAELNQVALEKKGAYGISADIDRETTNPKGSSKVTTEDAAKFRIRTINILGERYFFPQVEEEKINEKNRLPFYLIPVKGSKFKISNSNGEITIENPNKIYYPTISTDTDAVPGKAIDSN